MARRRPHVALAALLLLAACDSSVVDPPPNASLSLEFISAEGFNPVLDQGRVRLQGPTPRTVTIAPGSTQTIDGLVPGTYVVSVEGLTAGEVETFGEVRGVSVSAGRDTRVTVVSSSFVPVLRSLDTGLQPGETLRVEWSSVFGAESYRAEWDDDPNFGSPTVVGGINATFVDILLDDAGTYHVRVRAVTGLGDFGQASAAGSLDVNHPQPVLTSVDPTTAYAGEGAFELTANGSGFVQQSEVRWNGSARVTTYISSTELRAAIPANDIANPGSAQITVRNPSPGGGVSSMAAVTIEPAGETWLALASGQFHTCGATEAGVGHCWGNGNEGRLGNGAAGDRLTPTPISGGLVLSTMSARNHACALTTAGFAYCWGNGVGGRLGNGSSSNQLAPVPVSGGLVFATISAGSHTCGVTTTGAGYCWGLGLNGRLGNGSVQERHTPTLVSGGHVFQTISAGNGHTCAITTAGAAYCWGDGSHGRLGDGSTVDRQTPVLVNTGLQFKEISADGDRTCALTTAGAAYCWGNGSNGRLGDGATLDRLTPVPVSGGLEFASISAGTFHTCGVTVAGESYCWGRGTEGQLGDGAKETQLTPVKVSGALTFATISGGTHHTCAVTTIGGAFCWGNGGSGRLGDGSTTTQTTPVRVSNP